MNLLMNKIASILQREMRPIVIYGAGVAGAIIYSNIVAMYGENKKVKCFIDGNVYKQNGVYYGLNVYSPQLLTQWKNEIVILVATGKESGVHSFLDKLGYVKNRDYYDLNYIVSAD